MECQYRSKNGRFVFKIDGTGHKDIFEAIASVQEVFESDETCGLCSGPNLRFVVRTAKKAAKEFTYFELRCQDCGARFEFGQAQDMKSLFPKRNRDAQGNETEGRCLPNRGWYKYSPQSAPEELGEEEETRNPERGTRNPPGQPVRSTREARPAAASGKCPECGTTGRYHKPDCAHADVTAASAA